MDTHHRFTSVALERLQAAHKDTKARLRRAEALIRKQREIIRELEKEKQ